MLKSRLKARLGMIALCTVAVFICGFCFAEVRIRPLVREAAKSRARIFAAELINSSVTEALAKSERLVTVSTNTDGVSSVETDIPSLSRLRAAAVDSLTRALYDAETMSFSVPLGNLFSSSLTAGRGTPIEIRLVPIGDVSADIHTEFIESGINQTLHKITLRVRVTLNVLTFGDAVKLEAASDITLAETVIVGKVPDAYTAINRFEIDEDEENDLNDYAASIP